MNERSPVIGYILVIVAALAFAGNNAFAVLSYDGGTTPLTLITVRMIFTLIALTVLMKIAGRAIPLPRHERNAAFGLGLLNATMAFCLMSAFDHIAVGLAVLIFYLYPVFTGIGAWLTRQETLNKGILVGLVGSFAGLALALGNIGATASILGMALAGAAALLMTGVILLSARVLKTDNARSVTLHMHISGALMFVVISLIAGDFSLPQTDRGWVGFVAVPVFYTIAVATFFAGIAWLGGVRTSLVMNLEPIASIALGFVVLGQVLTERQLLGAALVIAAVTAVKWLSGKKTTT
ncbi:MAG: drug/metabolite transporter (DMT)-like permease [Paracoccaceae bacterium]|jgi:drug/metabolite transporter (DMT)-like permease